MPLKPSPVAGASTEALGLHERARLTAWAWLTAVRFRVRELAEQAGRLDACNNADRVAGGYMLGCFLDEDAVTRFVRAVDELDMILDDMLDGDNGPWNIPDVSGICRALGAGLAAR